MVEFGEAKVDVGDYMERKKSFDILTNEQRRMMEDYYRHSVGYQDKSFSVIIDGESVMDTNNFEQAVKFVSTHGGRIIKNI